MSCYDDAEVILVHCFCWENQSLARCLFSLVVCDWCTFCSIHQSIGAVNCIIRRPDGKLCGYNTDYVGAISAIEDKLRGMCSLLHCLFKFRLLFIFLPPSFDPFFILQVPTLAVNLAHPYLASYSLSLVLVEQARHLPMVQKRKELKL